MYLFKVAQGKLRVGAPPAGLLDKDRLTEPHRSEGPKVHFLMLFCRGKWNGNRIIPSDHYPRHMYGRGCVFCIFTLFPWYSKMSHNTRLKSNRFILNHELSEHCSFVK